MSPTTTGQHTPPSSGNVVSQSDNNYQCLTREALAAAFYIAKYMGKGCGQMVQQHLKNKNLHPAKAPDADANSSILQRILNSHHNVIEYPLVLVYAALLGEKLDQEDEDPTCVVTELEGLSSGLDDDSSDDEV
jgi:hypothetical protein